MRTIYKGIVMISTFYWMALDVILLPNAERGEDEAEDVLGGGGAGNVVQRTQRAVEVEQDHLMGCLQRHGSGRPVERRDSVGHQHLLANIGQKSCFLLGTVP